MINDQPDNYLTIMKKKIRLNDMEDNNLVS